jgi:hypothetical protein
MKNSWRDQEEVEAEVASTAFYAITDSIIDTHSAIKVLAITVTTEIGALAMFYVSKEKVLDFLEKEEGFWIYGAIGVFLVGFLTAFAAFRLLPSGFRRRFFRYAVWAVSIAAGLANIALFFMLLTFRMR